MLGWCALLVGVAPSLMEHKGIEDFDLSIKGRDNQSYVFYVTETGDRNHFFV